MRTAIERVADHENTMAAIEYAKPKPVKQRKQKVKSEYPPKPLNAYCVCGCNDKGQDFHHCFFGRRVDFPELNVAENLVLVNHAEHIGGKFDTWEWKKIFWKQKCKEYGEDYMFHWLLNLPAKLADRKVEFYNMVCDEDTHDANSK